MAYDIKHHIQAEMELKQRRAASADALERRTAEFIKHFPEYVDLRKTLAATGAKIARAAMLPDKQQAVEEIDRLQRETNAVNARIRALLLSGGYAEDYLVLIPSCRICSDTGLAGGMHCDCYKKAVERCAVAEMNEKSPLMLTGFDTFDISLYPEKITKQFGKNKAIREIMQEVFDYCKNYAENFHLPNAGMLMLGRTGLGKTHLSLAIAGSVMSKGYTAIHGSAQDMFRRVEKEHFSGSGDYALEMFQKADLLVIDDVGAEFKSSDFYVSTLYNLINFRNAAGKPTIVNTNLSFKELKQRYTERIVSRLLSMKILWFVGNDIRQIKSQEINPCFDDIAMLQQES